MDGGRLLDDSARLLTMAEMIFSGDLADKVLDGTKTVTRRPVKPGKPSLYQVGKTYAVQRKRGTRGLGPRVRVLSVEDIPIIEIRRDDAFREGFDGVPAFLDRWHAMYGTRYPRCWRIEFELAR